MDRGEEKFANPWCKEIYKLGKYFINLFVLN
jgi:hypothetical protein